MGVGIFDDDSKCKIIITTDGDLESVPTFQESTTREEDDEKCDEIVPIEEIKCNEDKAQKDLFVNLLTRFLRYSYKAKNLLRNMKNLTQCTYAPFFPQCIVRPKCRKAS